MRTQHMASTDFVRALHVAAPCQASGELPSDPLRFMDPFAPITPQTIAGGAPYLDWSLLDDGAAAERTGAVLAGCRAVGVGRGMAMGLAGVLEASLHAAALRFA